MSFESFGKDTRIFLGATGSNFFGTEAADDGVIESDPFATILTADIDSVMATGGALAMVIDDADEAILW